MSKYHEYQNKLNEIIERVKQEAGVFDQTAYDKDIVPGKYYYTDDYGDDFYSEDKLPNRELPKYWRSNEGLGKFLQTLQIQDLIVEILESNLLLPMEKFALLNQRYNLYSFSIHFLYDYPSQVILKKLLPLLGKLPENELSALDFLTVDLFNQNFFIECDEKIANIADYLVFLKTIPVPTMVAVLQSMSGKFIQELEKLADGENQIGQILDCLLDSAWKNSFDIHQLVGLYQCRFGVEKACPKLLEKITSNALDFQQARRLIASESTYLMPYMINMDDSQEKLVYLDRVLEQCRYLPNLSREASFMNTREMNVIWEEKGRVQKNIRQPSPPVHAFALPIVNADVANKLHSEASAPPLILSRLECANNDLYQKIQRSIDAYRKPSSFLERCYSNIRAKKAVFLECLLALINNYETCSYGQCIVEAKSLMNNDENITGEKEMTGNVYNILLDFRALDSTARSSQGLADIGVVVAQSIEYPGVG